MATELVISDKKRLLGLMSDGELSNIRLLTFLNFSEEDIKKEKTKRHIAASCTTVGEVEDFVNQTIEKLKVNKKKIDEIKEQLAAFYSEQKELTETIEIAKTVIALKQNPEYDTDYAAYNDSQSESESDDSESDDSESDDSESDDSESDDSESDDSDSESDSESDDSQSEDDENESPLAAAKSPFLVQTSLDVSNQLPRIDEYSTLPELGSDYKDHPITSTEQAYDFPDFSTTEPQPEISEKLLARLGPKIPAPKTPPMLNPANSGLPPLGPMVSVPPVATFNPLNHVQLPVYNPLSMVQFPPLARTLPDYMPLDSLQKRKAEDDYVKTKRNKTCVVVKVLSPNLSEYDNGDLFFFPNVVELAPCVLYYNVCDKDFKTCMCGKYHSRLFYTNTGNKLPYQLCGYERPWFTKTNGLPARCTNRLCNRMHLKMPDS